MANRPRKSREVDLFNFSFLDILACVIGLLIFVLSIVVVSGGGSNNRQTAGRLSNAEHLVEQARTDVQMASQRRQRAEQVLAQRAQDLANPKGTADAVRAQIQMLEDEKSNLDAAIATSIAKAHLLDQELIDMGRLPAVDPSAVEIQNELRRLDEQTAGLLNQAADKQRQNRANVKQVHYYVPFVREVHRSTLWVEVSGDRLWCVTSGDYLSSPIDEDSIRFTRLAGAKGTSISALVGGKARVPIELASAQPDDTVLEVALHSDGYEAFRELREWAWAKGFAVNWVPQDQNPIILTHTSHVFEQ